MCKRQIYLKIVLSFKQLKGEFLVKRNTKLDPAILSELIENSNRPYRILAKKLEVHPNSILHRIRTMEKSGIIKGYTAVLDFTKLGYKNSAMVLLKIRKGRVGDEGQLEPLKKIPELVAFYAVTGFFDVLGVINIRDQEHLGEVLKRMQLIPEILRTSTLLVLYSYKKPHEFNPFSGALEEYQKYVRTAEIDKTKK